MGFDTIHLRERERDVVWRVFAHDRWDKATRELAALPESVARNRRRNGLLPPHKATGTVPLIAGMEPLGHRVFAGESPLEMVTCMEVLSSGDRAVTITKEGKLRLSIIADGTSLWEADAIDNTKPVKWMGHILAVLGDQRVVTCGFYGKRVRISNMETGDALGEMHLGGCIVTTLVSIDGRRFAVGCKSGDILFCEQTKEGMLTETSRVAAADKQASTITSCSVYGERLVSASRDDTVAVWDIQTRARLAELGGRTGRVNSMDMNDSIVVMGCDQAPHVRVFSVANGYASISSIGAFDWVHSDRVHSVHILCSDHVMSVSADWTVAISAVKSNKVLGRWWNSNRKPLCVAALSDGSSTVWGWCSKATTIPAPPAAASAPREYGRCAHCFISG